MYASMHLCVMCVSQHTPGQGCGQGRVDRGCVDSGGWGVLMGVYEGGCGQGVDRECVDVGYQCRGALKWEVHILLECIFVITNTTVFIRNLNIKK